MLVTIKINHYYRVHDVMCHVTRFDKNSWILRTSTNEDPHVSSSELNSAQALRIILKNTLRCTLQSCKLTTSGINFII
jgi:hypothetical protein